LENGAARNVLLQADARYYWRFTAKQVFYAALDAAATHELDLDQQLLLGGEEGLRGYPLRYQSGTARALLTLEERYYTDWFPFRLFNVGGAVFFDAGRTWGQGPISTPGLGLLRDFGVGLRAGNSRSGLGNVVHIDLSYALDGDPTVKKLQVTVQTKQTF
jgi:hemolysin activation/secretion protein